MQKVILFDKIIKFPIFLSMESRLKSLRTSFFLKMQGFLPKEDFSYILSHYRTICFCPLPFKYLSVGHWLLLLGLFSITRSIAYSHELYYVFCRFQELSVSTGNQSNMRAMAYMEVLMWFLLYISYLPADLLLLNKSFHRTARNLFHQISEETRNIPNIKSGRRCLNLIKFNQGIVPISVMYFLITATWPGMNEFIQLYARLPQQFNQWPNISPNSLVLRIPYSYWCKREHIIPYSFSGLHCVLGWRSTGNYG